MGDMADMAIESKAWGELLCDEIRSLPKRKPLTKHNFVWTDIHGKKYKLKDIDDGYLANIIMFMKRKSIYNRYSEVIMFLEKEQRERIKRKSSFLYRLLRGRNG